MYRSCHFTSFAFLSMSMACTAFFFLATWHGPLSNIVCHGTHGNVFLYNSNYQFRLDHSLYERTILLRTVEENERSTCITQLYTFLHFVVLWREESTYVLHKSKVRSGTSHTKTEMMMSALTLPVPLSNLNVSKSIRRVKNISICWSTK